MKLQYRWRYRPASAGLGELSAADGTVIALQQFESSGTPVADGETISQWWDADALPGDPDPLDLAAEAAFKAADEWLGLPAHNLTDKPRLVAIAFYDGSTIEYRRES